MDTALDRTFPVYRFAGSHFAIGRQFGEACAEAIHRHRDLALERLRGRSGISAPEALAAALRYRPFVVAHAPFLDEEIQGVAAGAGLSLGEAYLLQLRAEIAEKKGWQAAESGDECTTFAVLPEAAAAGVPLIGQNADLPAFYAEIGVVVEIIADDAPAVLMLTPAGQVSYIGINDRGLGVFANFLTCDGWRVGFPRYLWSRLALAQETVADAIAAVRAVPRASSRNLIMLDAHGTAADLETTPTRDARLDPVDGLLAHANHYVGRGPARRRAVGPAPRRQLAGAPGADERAAGAGAGQARRPHNADDPARPHLHAGRALPASRTTTRRPIRSPSPPSSPRRRRAGCGWPSARPTNIRIRCYAFSGVGRAVRHRRKGRSGAEAMARIRVLDLIISERAESKMHDPRHLR